jgi:magnesium chelatase family protein
MLAKILSGAVVGLESVPVTVEVDISSQSLPSFTIVGLPDKAVEESKERVRSALKNSGAEFPNHRITVNLAPADLPKGGPAYDLPIAVGMLVASGQLPPLKGNALFVGELSLDGGLRHTNGILPLAMMVKEAGESNIMYVPFPDAKEAAVIRGISVIPVVSLLELFRHLTGTAKVAPHPHVPFETLSVVSGYDFDMSDVAGQEHVKRALEIAAAGAHNLFMQGPPGAGKTMLARTLPSILPVMTEEEALDVTKIYSVTGNLPAGESIVKFRPFRSPHHTTSRIGLIGGGTRPAPGEISLAHRGVLFLDEFPEYPRNVLEALRQPMEDGVVTISRAVGSVRFPAKFMLIAAANPCPCGNFRSDTKQCTCLPGMVARYQKRISGPIIDRIDLHVQVPAVSMEKLTGRTKTGQTSLEIKARVQRARNLQIRRFRDVRITANSEMTTKMVKECCVLPDETQSFLSMAAQKFALSARSYYRVIKISRTIADLAEERGISAMHIAEALQYRPQEQ